MNRKFKDLTGQKFGRLSAIEKVGGIQKHNGVLWRCKCDCGNEKIVPSGTLKSGNTRSCGCLANDIKSRKRGAIKDEENGKRITRIHDGMVDRCYNKNCKAYKYYGARGIKVCDEWRLPGGLRNFYNWAIRSGYDDTLTLDRIDVNGDYTPENCRWATYKQQANNKRDNRILEFNGESHTITEWEEFSTVTRKGIEYRLKNGWSIEDALFSPKTGHGGRPKKC